MRKLRLLLIIIIIVVLLCSCGGRSEIIFTGYTERVSETIIECFNNKDIDGLKEILSPYLKEDEELEEQIEAVFDEISGKITSYEVFSYGYDGSIREGKWVIKREQVEIRKIKTDEGEEYIINYSEYIKHSHDENKEGVYIICLSDSNGEILHKICRGDD